MFVVIYRVHVKPGLEKQYLAFWKTVAAYFVKERGALGSTLHKTDDGMWVAYSKWPDRATRDSSWSSDKDTINSEFPLDIREAIQGLHDCSEEEKKLPEICMEIKEEISCKK